jgi:hypothetical protein
MKAPINLMMTTGVPLVQTVQRKHIHYQEAVNLLFPGDGARWKQLRHRSGPRGT